MSYCWDGYSISTGTLNRPAPLLSGMPPVVAGKRRNSSLAQHQEHDLTEWVMILGCSWLLLSSSLPSYDTPLGTTG